MKQDKEKINRESNINQTVYNKRASLSDRSYFTKEAKKLIKQAKLENDDHFIMEIQNGRAMLPVQSKKLKPHFIGNLFKQIRNVIITSCSDNSTTR